MAKCKHSRQVKTGGRNKKKKTPMGKLLQKNETKWGKLFIIEFCRIYIDIFFHFSSLLKYSVNLSLSIHLELLSLTIIKYKLSIKLTQRKDK